MSNVYDDLFTKKPDNEVTKVEAQQSTDDQQDETEETAMFHCQRDSSKAEALILETKSDMYSFPYTYLEIKFTNNYSEIIVKFLAAHVTIKGRNLKPLFHAITHKKVNYIRSAKRNELEKDYPTYIDDIEIKEYDMG